MRRSGVRSSSSPPIRWISKAADQAAFVFGRSGRIAPAAAPPNEDIPMFSRLMPREGRFFDLFNAHSAQIVEGSRALALLIANLDASATHAERIDAAEHNAD